MNIVLKVSKFLDLNVCLTEICFIEYIPKLNCSFVGTAVFWSLRESPGTVMPSAERHYRQAAKQK